MRVLFFGRLRDLAGTSEIELHDAVANLGELRDVVSSGRPELRESLAHTSVRVAIDQCMATSMDADIIGAAEIAFMPPLSGG